MTEHVPRYMETLSNLELLHFLDIIDKLADHHEHPELFETDLLDRLLTLQEFASRLKSPTLAILDEIETIKEKMMVGDLYENNYEYFNKHLEKIEKENFRRFRTKTEANVG